MTVPGLQDYKGDISQLGGGSGTTIAQGGSDVLEDNELGGVQAPNLRVAKVIRPSTVRRFAHDIVESLSSDPSRGVIQTLREIAAKQDSPEFAEIINAVGDDLAQGNSLKAAFSKYPDVFDPLFLALTYAGELDGNIDNTLEVYALAAEKHFGALVAKLLNCGIPILQVLELAAAQIDQDFVTAVASVRDDLRSGETLADSFSKHPDHFSNGFISAVRRGEEMGSLDETLNNYNIA